jgi:uncharacterized protein (TIGR02466 family)
MNSFYGIFPSLISITSLQRSFTDKEIQCFTSSTYIDDHSLDHEQPTRISTTREENIISDCQLIDLETYILDSVKSYIFDFLKINDNIALFIKKSWLVKSKPGGFGRMHSHPNSILSGVLYYSTPVNCGNLLLHDKNSNFGTILFGSSGSNFFNSRIISVKPEPGKMVIFPSSMLHEVGMNNSNSDRISLSFDIWYEGVPTQSTNVMLL